MKHSVKSMLIVGSLIAGALGACTSELDAPLADNSVLKLAKAPDVIAYSGNHTWGAPGTSRSAYMNANMYDQDWDCVPNVDLTPEELEELKALLSPGHEVTNDVILPFENYWVQQVYKGTDSYFASDKNGNPTSTSVTGSNQMDLLLAYNDILVNDWDIYSRHQFNGGMYEHVNNFNNGDNQNNPGLCGCGITHEGTTLMIDMPTEGMTAENQFGYHETWGTMNKYRNNYIIVQYKGEWYVGFDYQAETDRQNPGEASQVIRDWNFTDWIVKITPAYHKGETPEKPNPDGPEVLFPENPDPGFTVDPENPEVEPNNPLDPGFNVNPGTPGTTNDEVEVNLSLEDHNDFTASHLSIHVRAATDVEVFIPVPVEYYCEADDMAIVQHHDKNHMIHGGPYRTEYTLQDKEDGPFVVILNVEYVEDGIRIWTEGIDQDVIDFCYKHYNDGITFEVWNYFNDTITKEELQGYLNQSTVKFLDKNPDYYINAFNQTESGEQFKNDCTVSIVDEQADDYNYSGKGNHYNGSPYNDIYENKDKSTTSDE